MKFLLMRRPLSSVPISICRLICQTQYIFGQNYSIFDVSSIEYTVTNKTFCITSNKEFLFSDCNSLQIISLHLNIK